MSLLRHGTDSDYLAVLANLADGVIRTFSKSSHAIFIKTSLPTNITFHKFRSGRHVGFVHFCGSAFCCFSISAISVYRQISQISPSLKTE
jgi:hypothetical protein